MWDCCKNALRMTLTLNKRVEEECTASAHFLPGSNLPGSHPHMSNSQTDRWTKIVMLIALSYKHSNRLKMKDVC